MRFVSTSNETLGADFLREQTPHILAQVKEGRHRLRVSMTIAHGDDGSAVQEVTATSEVTLSSTTTPSLLYDMIENVIHTKLARHFFYKGALREVDVRFWPSDPCVTVDTVPMRRLLYAATITGVEHVEETGRGCVWDILQKRFGITPEEGRSRAVTPKELVTICMAYKIRLAVFGLRGNIIAEHIPEKRNSRRKPLVIFAANEHAHLLSADAATNALKRRRVCMCMGRRKGFTVTPLHTEDFDRAFAKITANNHINRGVRTKGTKITSFEHDNVQYVRSQSFQTLAHNATLFSVDKSIATSIPRLMHAVQQKHTASFFPEVFFPDTLRPASIHAPFVFDNSRTHTHGLRAFDIRRCYTNALRGGDVNCPWTIPSEFDKVEEYNGLPLTPGRYLLEAQHSFPCKGTGWYWYAFVTFLQEEGIPHKIIAQQRAITPCAPPDVFATFIAAVEDALEPQLAKMYINHFIGSCKSSSKAPSTPSITTASKLEADAYLREGASPTAHVEKAGNFYYICDCAPKVFLGDRAYMYEQVLERSWVMLFRLWVLLGRLPIVYIHTDCICVDGFLGPPPNELKYREEAIATRPPYTPPSPPPTRPPAAHVYTPTSLCTFEGAPGLLVTGGAGTGKTTAVRQKLETVTKHTTIMAPTNRAASQAQGRTVHSKFGITREMITDSLGFSTSVSNTSLKLIASTTDIIWVDECFMCEAWMWQAFLKLRSLGVIFILSGDPLQLPPVASGTGFAKADVLNSAVLHMLSGGARCHLTEVHRSFSEVYSLAASLVSTIPQIVDKIPIIDDIEAFDRHLAFTNATCEIVNSRLLQSYAKKKRRTLVVNLHNHTSSVFQGKRAPVSAGSVSLTCGTVIVTTQAIGKVFKNEIGIVHGWDQRRKTVQAKFEGMGPVDLPFEYLGRIGLGFCITIHKSQSSTIADALCLHDVQKIARLADHKLKRALLYVACSRSAKGYPTVRSVL